MNQKLKLILLLPLFSLLAAAAALVAAEVYLRVRYPMDMEWTIAAIHQPDSELGYSGIPNAQGIDSMKVAGKYQYRVNLKLNEHGFREVAGFTRARGSRCVLLLGDSVAFGIGVKAEDTVASILQAHLKNTRVFNFGYSGYGPHQTLRFLEIGRERPWLTGCREVRAYYFGVEDNFWRALGRANWGLSGPAYRLRGGQLEYQGPFFPEKVNEWNNYLQKYRVESILARWFLGYGQEVNAQEHEIYLKIMSRIAGIVRTRYGGTFKVIYFAQGHDPRWPQFRKLEPPGMEVSYFENLAVKRGFTLAQVLPSLYLEDKTHMNEAGNRFLAKELLEGDLRGF